MKPSLSNVLSVNGGYVDTAGFLALHGLFTTHVTGNFVTLGAALVLGTSGAVTKLLALPMFCIMVIATRLLSQLLSTTTLPVLRTVLGLNVALLLAGGALAVILGPFNNGDGLPALVTGMTLVSAMAIQNAIHRIHMSASPPSTIMTGSTTQIMIDVADLIRGVSPDARAVIHARLSRLSSSVASFAIGCAAAALLYAFQGIWCFLVPPLIGGCAVFMRETAPPRPA
ncbi:MAG: hypothetical protein QOF42_1966 [Gammaproteobacteria bacterium]|jgi:uncharacterized membrane protein YoaK (UPF0700 family)|nr:hypothetical protein [Gammaproteobacteria bacterium]